MNELIGLKEEGTLEILGDHLLLHEFPLHASIDLPNCFRIFKRLNVKQTRAPGCPWDHCCITLWRFVFLNSFLFTVSSISCIPCLNKTTFCWFWKSQKVIPTVIIIYWSVIINLWEKTIKPNGQSFLEGVRFEPRVPGLKFKWAAYFTLR